MVLPFILQVFGIVGLVGYLSYRHGQNIVKIINGGMGFETCVRLKESPTPHDIPVIFMTALSETMDKVKGLRLGAVDYIIKLS